MTNIIKKIDSFICKYLGFYNQDIIPQYLERVGKNIILVNTESFRRHSYAQRLDEFISINGNKLNKTTKQKIGISAGKALANNLVITFDNVTIK